MKKVIKIFANKKSVKLLDKKTQKQIKEGIVIMDAEVV